MSAWRLGIDLGGTKTEVIVLHHGRQMHRKRLPTPSGSYDQIILAIAKVVEECRQIYSNRLTIGIGMPGAITAEGLVKNSNTVCLNGKPFPGDIAQALEQNVRIMNDANCFALSEAVDGAAAGASIVFGVILGTGVGGGIVFQQQVWAGCNSIAGEWGHNPLPITAPKAAAIQRQCYCGKYDCIETFLCGKGFEKTYLELTGRQASAQAISTLIAQSDAQALLAYDYYQQQLAASLSTVINVLDPNVIVLGGGLSQLPGLAGKVQALLAGFVFSNVVNTRVAGNLHGDSSGVRGAAWLWPEE